MTTARQLLRLAEGDNVCIVTAPIDAGQLVALDGERVRIGQSVDVGHKIAACPIAAGQQVVRFGMPIGSASRDIAAGEWVHTHNLASDYIRTFDHRGGDSA